MIPDAPTGAAPGVGEPFGEEHNCFGDGQYDRFRVPQGAALESPASYLGSAVTEVLRVERDHVDDVLAELGDEIGGHAEPDSYQTGDGAVRAIRYAAADANEGWEAGWCSVTASLDGQFILVLAASG